MYYAFAAGITSVLATQGHNHNAAVLVRMLNIHANNTHQKCANEVIITGINMAVTINN